MRKRLLALALIVVVLGAAGAAAYWGLTAGERRRAAWRARLGPLACEGCNLVVIALTNVRKDHVGLYGYQRPTTPNIDAFFQPALILDNAYSPASWTLSVSASLLSSLFPLSHGVMDRYDGSSLADAILTLPEILRAAGYQTAAFTGGGDYRRVFNLDQGFSVYVDEENFGDFGIGLMGETQRNPMAYYDVKDVAPAAVTWLKRHADRPFFLWLQGYDGHCPFMPITPFDRKFDPEYRGQVNFDTCLWTFEQTKPALHRGVRGWWVKTAYDPQIGIQDVFISDRDLEHMIARYDGGINQADWFLGSLFNTLRRLELERNTIVIFLAEHGDLFGEHGRIMRGGPLRGTFYEPVLNPPLVLRLPGLTETRRVPALFQSVDFLPTVLDLLGLDDPAAGARQGRTFVPALLDQDVEVNPVALAASRFTSCINPFFSGMSTVEAARDRRWKYMEEHVYDAWDGEERYSHRALVRIDQDPAEAHNLLEAEPAIAARLRAALDAQFPQGLRAGWKPCDPALREQLAPPPAPPAGGPPGEPIHQAR